MNPDIEEAIKRLEDEAAHTRKDCRYAPFEIESIVRLIAELRRLSAPVAPTYRDACAAACQLCETGDKAFTAYEHQKRQHWTPQKWIECTAPTPEEYMQSLERENAELRARLEVKS